MNGHGLLIAIFSTIGLIQKITSLGLNYYNGVLNEGVDFEMERLGIMFYPSAFLYAAILLLPLVNFNKAARQKNSLQLVIVALVFLNVILWILTAPIQQISPGWNSTISQPFEFLNLSIALIAGVIFHVYMYGKSDQQKTTANC
jgi:hypothetical protein